MKHVTPENIRARIAQIEYALNTLPGGFKLSINHEFELACLRTLLTSLESRTVTVRLPRPGFVTISGERMAVYLKADVDAAMLAAGIEESK